MMWFFAVLVVLAMGGVAAVAAGRGGSMVEEYGDAPDVRVESGPISAATLRRVRFTTALRGYRADEVDELLRRLAVQLEAAERDDEVADSAAGVDEEFGDPGPR